MPERLSSGVFEFWRLRVTGDGGQQGEAGGGRRALTLHEHGVQTSHFGGEECVNAVEHGEEVGELQLLWEKRNERRWRDNNQPPPPPGGASYLGFNRLGVLILEQKLDFAFPVVGRSLQLGELVSPQHRLSQRKRWEVIICWKVNAPHPSSLHRDRRGSREIRRRVSRLHR